MNFDKYQKNGAYHYKWYDDPNWVWYKECVDRIVNFCKGTTIDVGCGDGLVMTKIKHNGYAVVGLDNNDKALSIAKEKSLSVSKMELDEGNTVQVYGGYDYVCCLNTIEHLSNPISVKSIIEQAKKGAIIITDKATNKPGRYHNHEYTKEELLKVFKEFKPKYFEINSTEFGKPITFIGVEITK